MTRARELAVAYPSLPADAPAADLLPSQRAEVAQVDGDATLIEVAAAMARTSAPLVAVRDRDGRLLGGITTSQLITRLLGAPQ